jgi:hypothetical protein
MRSRALLAAALPFVVVACSSPPAAEPDAAATASPSGPIVSATVDPLMDIPDEPQAAAVVIARRMFAEDLGVSAAAVAVESVQEVVWNDGSLGCPQPGTMYTQAQVPGYRITITDGRSRTGVYHAGEAPAGGAPTVIRCDKPAVAGDQALGGPALDLAKADLADRLGTSEEIELVDSFVAPVASLVCQDQVEAAPVEGPQRVILEFHLQAGGAVHIYRSWADEIIYCGPDDDVTIE